MSHREKLEQVMDLLINEEHDAAEELLHKVMVEKAREAYESLVEDEFGGDMRDDFADEIEADVDEIEADEILDDEGMDDVEVEDEDVEDRVEDLEAALADLRAEFDALMGGDEVLGADKMDMDMEVDADMDMDMDMDMEVDAELEESAGTLELNNREAKHVLSLISTLMMDGDFFELDDEDTYAELDALGDAIQDGQRTFSGEELEILHMLFAIANEDRATEDARSKAMYRLWDKIATARGVDLTEATKLQDPVADPGMSKEGKLAGTGAKSKTGKTGTESPYTRMKPRTTEGEPTDFVGKDESGMKAGKGKDHTPSNNIGEEPKNTGHSKDSQKQEGKPTGTGKGTKSGAVGTKSPLGQQASPRGDK